MITNNVISRIMSYIKYRMSYTSNVYRICPLMPIYIHVYINYIFSFRWGEGNKSLDVLCCRVEGDSGDDGALLTRSLDLLLRLFSRSNWYKESRYESIFIIRWTKIYVHKIKFFLPPSNSHFVSPPRRLVDDHVWRDPTTIQ